MLTTVFAMLVLGQCPNGSCSQWTYRTTRRPTTTYYYTETVQTQPQIAATPVVNPMEERLSRLEKELAATKDSVTTMQKGFDRLVTVSEKQTKLLERQLEALTAIQKTTEQFNLLDDAPLPTVRLKDLIQK